jgi:hypothetical protein
MIHEHCSYLGGSDARTIMGADDAALLRPRWEKRGEVEPQVSAGRRGGHFFRRER